MTVNEPVSRHLIVRGRVQGVGYRNYIQYKASLLNIKGWVRNRLDGSVEAVVHGSPEAVAEIIDCAKRGPRAAEVTAVTVSDAEGRHEQFVVRPTE
jgi:acylphosphatase